MKKTISILLAAMLCLSLMAACQPQAAAPAPAEAPATAPEAAPAAETPTEAPVEEVKTYDKPELTLKFPEINADAGDVCKMERYFADLVKERSHGRIQIDVFGGGQLGDEAQTMEQLRLGVVDFIRINPANASTRGIDVPEYTALGLPYLIQSIQGGIDYLYSDSGKAVADKVAVATNGEIVSMYNYIVTTPRHMYTKTLVTNLEEMKNLKIRSETSEIKVDMINCWASATPLPFADIYTSLQTGVIDGCENAFHGYRDNAWYEVAPYCLLTGHSINASIYLMSGITWGKLTAEEQVMVIEAMKESCDWFQNIQDEGIVAVEAELREKGVTFTEPTDPQAWQDACKPLYEKYAVGLEDFIADIQSYK